MKRSLPMVYLLAFIAIISGYLVHKMSWLARMGVNWFYKEYSIFKSWWQTSALEFVLFMALLAAHHIIETKAKRTTARMVYIGSILIALAGLYITYADFRHDLSHRIAGERFHIGFYLFWIGWTMIPLRFLFLPSPKEES